MPAEVRVAVPRIPPEWLAPLDVPAPPADGTWEDIAQALLECQAKVKVSNATRLAVDRMLIEMDVAQ